MTIPDDMQELAVGQVFNGKRVASGGHLYFSEIAEEWERIGLRVSDLLDALRKLVEKQYLVGSHRQGAQSYQLTPAGHEYFSGQDLSGPRISQWLREVRQWRARQAGKTPIADELERRRH